MDDSYDEKEHMTPEELALWAPRECTQYSYVDDEPHFTGPSVTNQVVDQTLKAYFNTL